MKLYMEVTGDKYQLPLAVADTITELARMRKVYRPNISAALRYCREHGIEGKYVEIIVDGDDDDETGGGD